MWLQVTPEVLYCAKKAGVTHVLKAGGAQAVAAMAWGTETCPKVMTWVFVQDLHTICPQAPILGCTYPSCCASHMGNQKVHGTGDVIKIW